MPDDAKLIQLIGEIYDAALAPERLPALMQAICDALGATAGGIHVRHLQPVERACQVWVGLPPDFERPYLEHYYLEDPWAPGAMASKPGVPYLGQELVPARDLDRTEFFHDLCRPHGFADLAGSLLVHEPGTLVAAFGLFRAPGQPRFAEADRARIALLAPHLTRLVRLLQQRERAAGDSGAARTVVDALGCGAILLDEQGQVLWASQPAERMLAAGDGVWRDAGALRCDSLTETAELRARIAAALAIASSRRRAEAEPAGGGAALAGAGDGLDQAARAPLGLAVRRRSARRPYDIRVVPVGAEVASSLVEPRARAVVLITDPEDIREPPAETLRRLFGLTPAEISLARRIARGLTPKEAAAEAAVSWNTARYQLRQVFAKTGTGRQADLVRLLTALGAVDFEGPGPRAPDQSPPRAA